MNVNKKICSALLSRRERIKDHFESISASLKIELSTSWYEQNSVQAVFHDSGCRYRHTTHAYLVAPLRRAMADPTTVKIVFVKYRLYSLNAIHIASCNTGSFLCPHYSPKTLPARGA